MIESMAAEQVHARASTLILKVVQYVVLAGIERILYIRG
jgi:hypothetical protein